MESVPRQRVSRTAFITIIIVVVVLLLICFIVLGVVTIARIQRNASPQMLAVIDKETGLQDLFVPKERVADKLVPTSISRVHVSNSPIVDFMHNFITDDEADYIIQLARGRFKPSTTMDGAKQVVNKDRTSESVFLNTQPDYSDGVLKAVAERAAQVAGIPVAYMEPLQVVKYEFNQYYRQHFDYLDESSDEVRNYGQRTATILVYLNTLGEREEGGGTKFHVLDHTVKPEKGAAVFWVNVTDDGKGDPRTLHSGEPLTNPTSIKYAINIWFRDRPQKHHRK